MTNSDFENNLQGRDDLPETLEAHHRVRSDQARAANSNSLADKQYCILAGSPQWEQWALSIPVDQRYYTPIQNPDGSFVPMVGIDDVG